MDTAPHSRSRLHDGIATAWFVAGVGIAVAAFSYGFTLPGATAAGVDHPDLVTLRKSAFLQPRLANWTIPGCLAVIVLGGAMGIAWQTLRAFLAKPATAWLALALTVISMIWSASAGTAVLDDYYVVLGNAYSGSPISYVARAMGTLGAGAIVLLPASMFACALGKAPSVDTDKRRRQLNLLLYLTAAGLAAGAIAARARLELAISEDLYASPDRAQELAYALEVAKHASLAYGGLFTVLLVVVYPTVAYLLRNLAPTPAHAKQPHVFKDLFKLSGHLLAVLGPLLAPFFESMFL